MQTESLHIPTMHRDFILKALNTSCCHKRAAKRLGMTERNLFKWKKDLGIAWDEKESKYIIKDNAGSSAELRCKSDKCLCELCGMNLKTTRGAFFQRWPLF